VPAGEADPLLDHPARRELYIPLYPGPCPPPYVIDACDTLTWMAGEIASATLEVEVVPVPRRRATH
jgi:hypothetical protein